MLKESITQFRSRAEARPQMARTFYTLSELCIRENQNSKALTYRKEARSLLQQVTGKVIENDVYEIYEDLIPYRNR